ncbi:MAG: hypothetical protein HYZ93_00315 [Candidatus Omnitrophica bacterium]|nr:hypothetical protein [Candidatus Omnitrophota bacterium]
MENGWTVEYLRSLEEMNRRFSDRFKEQHGFTSRPRLFFSKAGTGQYSLVTIGSKGGPLIGIDVASLEAQYARAYINRWYLEEWVHSLQRDLVGGEFRETELLSPEQAKRLLGTLQKGVRAPDPKFSIPPFDPRPFLFSPLDQEDSLDSFDFDLLRGSLEVHAAALGWVLALDWLPIEPAHDPLGRSGAYWDSSVFREEGVLRSLRRQGLIGTPEYGIPLLAFTAGILEGALQVNRSRPFLPDYLEKEMREMADQTIRTADSTPIPMHGRERFEPLKEAYKNYFLATVKPFLDRIPGLPAAGLEEPALIILPAAPYLNAAGLEAGEIADGILADRSA